MKNKLVQKSKRLLSGIVATAIATSMLPTLPVMAKETTDKYLYTLFAASNEKGAITVNAGNFCVNGNVATNGTIVSSGNMNINGTKTENANESMVFIFDKIDSRYFSTSEVDEFTEDYTLEEINININTPTEVMGETTLTGNININTALKSLEDVNLYGEVKNTNDSIIFSKYGDIIIDSQNVNLNGLVYAPFGDVEVTAQNLNLNNVVIIADTITLNCPNVNANYSGNAAEFVGTVSDPLDIPVDEWQYMRDKNENGIIDFFENYKNWEQMLDSDNDSIPNMIENYIEIDPYNPDTDSDKLPDAYELSKLNTNPNSNDTDGNGILDCDEDFDNDGLTNHNEYIYDTSPWVDDTDDDNLTDGEEINTYGTNPLEPDTDFDGLEDSDEIYLGTDPTLPDTDNDGILDCDERFNQTFTHIVENEDCAIEEVIVSMEGTGNLQTNTTIESVMDKDVLCSEVVGLVGEPFSIETISQFDTATLTFKIDQSKLGDTEFDNLMFLWYDEENYKFVELETFYDYENSTVSIETTHFSRYMIVDKFKWFEAWSVEFNYRPTDGGCKSNDTIITIDCSGSMYNYDTTGINSKRAQAASNFFDTMRDGDRAGVVTFTNSAEVTCNLTDSQTDLANGLDNIYSSGGTNFSAALNTALTVFDEDDTLPINKRIILLSDGQDSVPYAVLDECNERNVVVYTIGLGSSSDSILETIATYTGGEFFKAYTADELLDIYSDIGITSDFDTTDTDGDGLYDVVESAGIRLQNGKIINTDPTNSDSDDDGLSDGKEIDPKIRQFYVPGMPSDVAALQPYYFVERSDPNSEDSDGDGLFDGDYRINDNKEIIAPIDEHPLKIDGPVGAWNKHIDVLNNPKNIVPTVLDKWYGYTQPVIEQPNYGAEGFFAFKGELDYLEEQGKLKLSDSQKNMILTFSAPFVTGAVLGLGEMGENETDNMAINVSKMSFSIIMANIESGITDESEKDKIMASLGSRLLNFKSDNQGVIHSQNIQWQLIGGYNNLYDDVFREYTNYTIRNEKFAFTVDNFEYILWIWRGNYLNLGAGAEMGLYYRPTILPSDPDGLDHYFAYSRLTLPMQLYLYDYESGKNIFSWEPTDDQWWITGFDPKYKDEKADAKNQVMIGSVKFPNGEMYEAFVLRLSNNQKKYIVLDENNRTVWICWCEESLI